MELKRAIVVLSGGMDSTISMFSAMAEGYDVIHAVTFDYGQRHSIEIQSAKRIASIADIDIHIIPIDIFKIAKDSALVGNGDINVKHHSAKNLPASFVPGRNILFLTVAAINAYKYKAHYMITGVCETDYSGYPDCRHRTIKSLEDTLSYGMDYQFSIITPLMYLNKKESIEMVRGFPTELAKKCFYALSFSHTCYEGEYPPCEKCPACKLRAKGFEEAGVVDPLLQRYKNEAAEF